MNIVPLVSFTLQSKNGTAAPASALRTSDCSSPNNTDAFALNAASSTIECAEWSATLSDGGIDGTIDTTPEFLLDVDRATTEMPESVYCVSQSKSAAVECYSSSEGHQNDREGSNSQASMKFELFFGYCETVHVDWSKQLAQWSLSLRTTDTTLYTQLDQSKDAISKALETGFVAGVSVSVFKA